MDKMNTTHERDLDQINQVLSLAKLEECDINPVSQSCYFSLEDNKNYALLELDPCLESKLKEGKVLRIKGGDDENAVLCTEDRTYDLLEAEASNSIMICENLKFFDEVKDETERRFSNVTVECILYNYLAVSPGKPHFKKLLELLGKSEYKGAEHEYKINPSDLYTSEDLKIIIQASDRELDEFLSKKHVLIINNKLRLLDEEYHFRVLSYMLKIQTENSWDLDEIDYDETINSLKDIFPDEILRGLFDKYAEESQIIDGVQKYRYKEADVCRFFAQILLNSVGTFLLEEFLNAWQESVPEGMTTKEEYLHGIALINRNVNPNTVNLFKEDDLPENIPLRFEILFGKKEKWTVAEIAPYIQRLTTDKLNVNALLAKYARSSNVNGVKYYSAKHGK